MYLTSGFNTSGLRFLNFFNDPRIIREQRIAAYKGYRGGGVVQIGMKELGPYLYPFSRVKTRLKDVASPLAAAAEKKKKKHMVPSLLTMERSKLLSKLLRDI
ncbi:hypothetical protein Tco_0756487 [Tanacetum coccineum]